MKTFTLRVPAITDDSWEFQVPQDVLSFPPTPNKINGPVISFSIEAITLRIERFPSNRILNSDDPSKFLLMSFNRTFRFPEQPPKVTVEYITRMMKKGFFLNGVQYRFYHHSNSQLRGRSCFLRAANSDAELDTRIYRYGDFEKIMNVAKRAKRIGLLFSSAQIDYNLDPRWIEDISDIKLGDEVFSDGCGLISKRLSIHLSRAKSIIFRGTRYTPVVFQIRYLGYKGVLMLHPELDKTTSKLAQFRKSMKKFNATIDNTFSVVGHSRPYSFGRLNNDIIVLLSSLGVSNERLLAKQEEYFQWISDASKDPTKAVDFLSCLDLYPLAEKVLLNGLDDPEVMREIRRLQSSEISKSRDERTGKYKSRMMIHKSRRLFGVCDPFQVLKEGEVHIRITASRKGPSTPIHGDVIIVRNPCLHPGDCLKLRAVDHPSLSHLVDCLVFASMARPGHKAAPSMSSGGDLDGDEFFVTWDKDIIPSQVLESYDYPGNREFSKLKVTRDDLVQHFASYSGAGVARVSALHAKWARSSPDGALSVQCQELNALHSQCVDGANIKIPDKLATPPEQTEPFILDLLEQASVEFSTRFGESASRRTEILTVDQLEGERLLGQLLKSNQSALSEYELFNLAYRLATKYSINIRPYLAQIDMSALTTAEKHTITTTLSLSAVDYPYIWNSLVRSDILTPRDLYQRNLKHPFSIHRLYSSRINGFTTFFEFLRMATQDYTRKVLIFQTNPRFAIGIFMRGNIPWEVDPEVDQNVVVCSFMPNTSSSATLRPCTPGYRLHCGDARFQLYNKHIGDTFVFIKRPTSISGFELTTSIALQKITATVQRQLGRVVGTPIIAAELHVVSNRDRVAHQLFDLWFEHVPTEEHLRRFQRKPIPYHLNDIQDVDWSTHSDPWMEGAFYRYPGEKKRLILQKHTVETMQQYLLERTMSEIEKIMTFAIQYHAEDEIFLVFTHAIGQQPLSQSFVTTWIERYPSLVFALLKAFPPDEEAQAHPEIASLIHQIVRNIVRSANDTRIAALVALEKLAKSIGAMDLDQYIDILMLTSLSVRSKQLVQEVLLVLNDCRLQHAPESAAAAYGHKHALCVVFDRAEEAADECPCNDDGRPRKKQKVPPSHAKVTFGPDYLENWQVIATIRVDAKTTIRLHSHVRLQAASKAENRWLEAPIMDGVVTQASKGELKINLFHPGPPEMEVMDWNLYDAGSIATTNAMMDALKRLLADREECCVFYKLIVGEEGPPILEQLEPPPETASPAPEGLNESQILAMSSWRTPLSLIWGPPGTGKTTVMVQILRDIIKSYSESVPKILMTASTHNAVDNVLERFIKINAEEGLLLEEQVLRVATDVTKVNQSLQNYTINARVGGDMNENNKLFKQAQDRVDKARLVFTTCAGAGLGILRKVDFEIALIDEASQITEPCALIPLVKGITRAVIVGDHVQLRPTVRNMAKALEYDVSLLERLYTASDANGIEKTMLDVQYRSPRELNAFPSKEFYEDRLKTSEQNAEVANFLALSGFPWPVKNGTVIPTVFVQCGEEEDMGSRSKSNEGQVKVVQDLLPLLSSQNPDTPPEQRLSDLKITVLSPYTKQIQALRQRLPSSVTISTIDSFQGRESDIIIFSTVRCNVEGDVGFLDDPRRLNVMWTRARLALIIIGDRKTMSGNPLWKRALDACTEVELSVDPKV